MTQNRSIIREEMCDLVVLGGGGGGLVAAARAACISDCSVIVLERNPKTGGGAQFASAIRTFGSRWQKERGLDDQMEHFFVKSMDDTYWRLDPLLIGNILRGTGQFFDWFCETAGPGVEDQFEKGFYIFDGPEGPEVPLLKGSYSHYGSGKLFMEVMLKTCEEKGVKVLTKHRAVDAETENGKISAILAETSEGLIRIRCRACIISTGSWISNKEVMAKVEPRYLNIREMAGSCALHCAPYYTGDAIAIAEKAGAFVDYDSFCLRMMGPVCLGDSEVISNACNSPCTVFINTLGKRWTCESSHVRMGLFESGHALFEQPEAFTYVVFDESILEEIARRSRITIDGYAGFFGHYAFPESMDAVHENIDLSILGKRPNAMKADTLEELAEKMGIDAKVLTETINRYNQFCLDGEDQDFFKSKSDLIPLTRGPYYAVKGPIGSDGAFGGVPVTPKMEAIAQNGGVVEGLYVVGDFASGKHLNMAGVKVQAINDSSWAFAGGFLAANSACDYLKDCK